jgi:hypothetical protein
MDNLHVIIEADDALKCSIAINAPGKVSSAVVLQEGSRTVAGLITRWT